MWWDGYILLFHIFSTVLEVTQSQCWGYQNDLLERPFKYTKQIFGSLFLLFEFFFFFLIPSHHILRYRSLFGLPVYLCTKAMFGRKEEEEKKRVFWSMNFKVYLICHTSYTWNVTLMMPTWLWSRYPSNKTENFFFLKNRTAQI